MDLTYDLDATTIMATAPELEQHRGVIRAAKKSEEKKGRKVTVLVRLEIHEAGDKQVELAPMGRLFPRPLKHIGACVPEIVVDKLRAFAKERNQPMSDVTRVLYTEFLIAMTRDERGDGWSKYIEQRLNDVLELRESKKKISYARTKQVSVRPKQSRRKRKQAKKR